MSFYVSRYGERQWKNKENCWGIQEFFCDLTNETSDIWEPYYGRVRTTLAGIHSGWTMTQRFTPWWESEFHCISLHLLSLTLNSPHGAWLASYQALGFADVHTIISFDLILRTTLADGFYCSHLQSRKSRDRVFGSSPACISQVGIQNGLHLITELTLHPTARMLPPRKKKYFYIAERIHIALPKHEGYILENTH